MSRHWSELLLEVHQLREQAKEMYATAGREAEFVENTRESLVQFLRLDAANLRAVTELHMAIAARNDEIADLLEGNE